MQQKDSKHQPKITKLEYYNAIEKIIAHPDINYDKQKINYNQIAKEINWNANSTWRYCKIILAKKAEQKCQCKCCIHKTKTWGTNWI